MENKKSLKRQDLIEPELSYLIVGILFEVYNELGPGHREQAYQSAVGHALQEAHIRFQEQVYSPLQYHGKKIGKYFLDFLIEGRVILELKQGNHFSKINFQQVTDYLQTTNIPLAILANFTHHGVVFRRILKPTPGIKNSNTANECTNSKRIY